MIRRPRAILSPGAPHLGTSSMNILHRLRQVRPIEAVLAAGLAFLAVAVFTNVMLRLFFQSGITATEEISRILLIWLVLIGAVAALHDNGHLGMNILVARLSRRWKTACAILACALMLLCDFLLLFGAYRQFRLSRFDSYPVTGLPLSIIYLAGIIAAVLFIAISGARLVRLLIGRMSAAEFFGEFGSDTGTDPHAIGKGAIE